MIFFRLASFNLRYDKPDAGDCNWRVRCNAVAAVVRHYQLDLMGTQEGFAHQLLDLHRLLPDYQSIGCDRDGDARGERCAIFYRQPWDCLQSGNFWLSHTPEVPGSICEDWGNFQPRMVTWGVFRRDDFTIALLNTHLDYTSAKARQKGVEVLAEQLPHLNLLPSYLCITGDFNCKADSSPRQYLQQQLQLTDVLAERSPEAQMTYHEFTGNAFDAVDTIYLDSRLQQHNCDIESGQWSGVYPSDHYPVIVEASPR